MKKSPLVLLSPSTQNQGAEFADASISLSNRYPEAVIAAGGVPWIMPCVPSRGLVAESVRRCDGVLLTGGNDVQPKLYQPCLPAQLEKKVGPADPERDLLESLLIDEVFRQQKPMLAICRGQQILNVALGGTLIVDIPTQKRGALQHNQPNRKYQPVHQVSLSPDSHLAKICGKTMIEVNSTHHQAVDRVAKPLKVTATSADGVIEGIELNDEAAALLPYLVSVQFHPERLFDRYEEFSKLFRSFIRACCNNRNEP
jgi:putative glutamine amidotransferase